MTNACNYLRWFKDLRLEDVPLVGGKNASLGELYRELSAQGVHVPNGFALTARAYFDAIRDAGTAPALHALLDDLDITDVARLATNAAEARRLVYGATGHAELRRQIGEAYRELQEEYGPNVAVAVRSSATAEDLPTASFAGQHSHRCSPTGPSSTG